MAGQRETLTLGFRVLVMNIRVVMRLFWASVLILGQKRWPVSKLVYINIRKLLFPPIVFAHFYYLK